MYDISYKIKEALKNPTRRSSISGELKATNGKVYPLNDGNIIKDSLYITNQIVNDNKLCFGSVYAGECGLVINSTIDRYSLYGATITLKFLLELASGSVVELPLGVFIVDTPERIGSKIKLTAIDNMSKFDITVNEDVNGTWYELLYYIANKCGVELAQTQAELEALHANANNQNYTIQQDKVDTYRDVLSYLCMVVCANATINNVGKLKIVQYATNACDENDEYTRLNNCIFSDYTTKYLGVKARFIVDDKYKTYTAGTSSGLVLDFGDIPIVGGTEDSRNETIHLIMKTVEHIEYVPATLYIASNPAYELGDMLTCAHVNNTDNVINTYVMSYKYSYRQKEVINCYGENPLLKNIKDKTDKKLSSLANQMSSKDVVVVNATNAKDITIGQDLTDVVTLNFSVNTDCRPICIFTIPFSIDVDGYVEFSLYNSLVAIENAIYKDYYEAGEHFATFMYLDDMKADERRSLRVLAKCYADVTSAIRVQDAKIRILEKMASVPMGDIFPQNKAMWESGFIHSVTGKVVHNTRYICSYFVPIKAGQKYYFTADTSHEIGIAVYTADKTLSAMHANIGSFELTTGVTAKYIRVDLRLIDNSEITVDELDNVYCTLEPVIDEETVDTTEPTATILATTVKAIAYAQGINTGKAEWDGTLEFTEAFGDTPLSKISVITFNDNMSVSTQTPTPTGINELFGEIALSNTINIVGFTDIVTTGNVITGYLLDTTNGEYNSDYVTADGAYMMKTEYKYSSTEQTIDSGKTCSVAIDYTGLTVESVVVENE